TALPRIGDRTDRGREARAKHRQQLEVHGTGRAGFVGLRLADRVEVAAERMVWLAQDRYELDANPGRARRAAPSGRAQLPREPPWPRVERLVCVHFDLEAEIEDRPDAECVERVPAVGGQLPQGVRADDGSAPDLTAAGDRETAEVPRVAQVGPIQSTI